MIATDGKLCCPRIVLAHVPPAGLLASYNQRVLLLNVLFVVTFMTNDYISRHQFFPESAQLPGWWIGPPSL